MYVLFVGLVGGLGEQRSVREGSCPAVGLRGVTTFGDHGTVQLDAWALCVQREWGTCAAPRGGSSLSGRAEGGGVTQFSHSSMELHLSMAPPARAPLPLPSDAAPPDFPRCPFPLC